MRADRQGKMSDSDSDDTAQFVLSTLREGVVEANDALKALSAEKKGWSKRTTDTMKSGWGARFNAAVSERTKAITALDDCEIPRVQGRLAPPIPSGMPKLTVTHNTTVRDVQDYLSKLGHFFTANNFRLQRLWIAALLQAVIDPSQHDQARILMLIVDRKLEWAKACEVFTEIFARRQAHLDGVEELATMQQGKISVEAHADIFSQAVEDTMPVGVGEDWQKHPLYIFTFFRSLKGKLRDALTLDPRFADVCANLGGMTQLAAKKERELYLADSLVTGDSTFGGALSVDDTSEEDQDESEEPEENQPDLDMLRSNTRQGSKRTAQTLGSVIANGSKSIKTDKIGSRVACTRCGRVHLGGAEGCWSMTHVDGSTITSAPTASIQQVSSAGCAWCGGGHQSGNCPMVQSLLEQREGATDRE